MRTFWRLTLLPVLCCLLAIRPVSGQTFSNNEAYGLNKVVPASPNAASLGKYGETPVSLYSGIPSISIPIYEINEGRIKLPISLNYHAGGIKVEEIASWAGLGWSLSSGASITRTVMGLPDEGNDGIYGSGYFNVPNSHRLKTLLDSTLPTMWWRNEMVYRLTKIKDGEPDVFTVSVGGFSGKFFYNQEEQRFFSVPASNLKINKIDNPNNGSFDFEIINENGLVYTFNVLETNRLFDYWTNITDREIDFPTSWFLSSIHDPVTQKNISFSYDFVPLSYETMKSEVQYFDINDIGFFEQNKNVNVNRLTAVRLTNIHFGDGHHIDFITENTTRQDLNGDKALQFIKVFSGTKEIKRIELKHSYFQSDNLPDLVSDIPNIHSYAKRLKLDSLVEYDPVTNIAIRNHKFEYNQYTLPNRLSYAQDLWGYCNGQTNYPSLIPALTATYFSNTFNIPGSNRNVNPTTAQACILKKITYPTAGHTEFEYESNRIPYANESYDKIQKVYSVSQDPQNPALYLEMPLTMNEPEGGAMVTFSVNFDMDNWNAYQSPVPPFIITLTNTATNTEFFYYEGIIQYPVQIPNGNYLLKIDFTQNPYPATYTESNIVCLWMGTPTSQPTYTLVGGLRIKQIRNYDPVSDKAYNIQDFYYTEENNDTIPSGRIRANPNTNQYLVHTRPMNTPEPVNIHYCLKRFQYSQYPLSSAGGGPAEYQTVTVITRGENTNIKKVTNFFGLADYEDQYLSQHDGTHFKPLTSYEHFRGFEKSVKEYAFAENTYKLIREKKFEYSNLNGQRTKFAYGVTGGFGTNVHPNEPIEIFGETYLDMGAWPILGIYKIISDKLVLSQTVEKNYTLSGQVLTDSIVYDANPKNFAIAQSKKMTSNGDTLIEKIKYPVDYMDNLTGSTGWLTGLVNLHNANMNNTPIETARFVKNSNSTTLSGSFVTLYNNELLPGKIISTDNQALTDYSMTYSAGNALNIDNRHRDKIFFTAYDAAGNLLAQQKANDVTSAYIWDYANTFPVAEVINAQPGEIAYTSFEADSKGNWTFSGSTLAQNGVPTGNKVYDISNGITKSTLSAGTTYIISYWRNSNSGPLIITGNSQGNGYPQTGPTINGWTLYTHRITGVTSTSISGTGLIDELRLYPENAQMVTYAYEPLIGITSQSDINNNITYYEYDGFGRLKLMRDKDRNILKVFCYNYAGQPEDCEANTSALWQPTGTLRCQTGTGNYLTGKQERQEKDNNPYSSTYNTIRWVETGSNPTACPITPDWQNTATPARCKTNGQNQNTGEQEQEQRDMNPYSTSYNTIRWTTAGVNLTACPLPYVFAKITLENVNTNYADVVVRFYTDEQCTIPHTVTNLSVLLQEEVYNDLYSSSTYNNHTVTCNGTETTLLSSVLTIESAWEQGVGFNIFRYYSLLPESGYVYIP